MAEDWKLSRLHDGYDWSLTNTSGKVARDVYIEFQGVVDGRRWREGVTPSRSLRAIGEVQPYQTVQINIDSSDTVDKVTVYWRSRLRRKTWETTA
ncbi:hypothetical protein [Nonomuraea turcica]|uniref:hypothetical protein n=1 Tax=Nonomuraea sp. G32 TaxID=3067274 RepID=UPI00273B5883|nr:hypothetical protein [Nonomuraea sp. G32]MDP4505833.1 hypothetical protein [Nonomuraea sp. G32]